MMPSSRKGKGTKRVERRPVPITPGLAAKLRAASARRRGGDPLLLQPDGTRWQLARHVRPFAEAATEAGLAGVTAYALRHSSIIRALLAGVPVRVVAVNHDTSVMMLERTYSAHIADHSDVVGRRALLDLAVSP